MVIFNLGYINITCLIEKWGHTGGLTAAENRARFLLNADVEYLLLYLNMALGGEKEERSSIMHVPPQSKNLLTAELSTQTAAATWADQGRPPAGPLRVTGLQSRETDRTPEYSINLPTDRIPVWLITLRCLTTDRVSHRSSIQRGIHKMLYSWRIDSRVQMKHLMQLQIAHSFIFYTLTCLLHKIGGLKDWYCCRVILQNDWREPAE